MFYSLGFSEIVPDDRHLNWDSHPPKKLFYQWKALKNNEECFSFHVKNVFWFSEHLNLYFEFFSHLGKRLDNISVWE